MIALAGAGGRFHLPKQRVHLFRLERTAGAHRMMAGDRRQPMVELALERLRAVFGGEVFGEIAHQRRHVGAVEQRRRFAQQRRAGAERLDDQAQRLELARPIGERGGGARLEIDDQGLSRICRAMPFCSRWRLSFS